MKTSIQIVINFHTEKAKNETLSLCIRQGHLEAAEYAKKLLEYSKQEILLAYSNGMRDGGEFIAIDQNEIPSPETYYQNNYTNE